MLLLVVLAGVVAGLGWLKHDDSRAADGLAVQRAAVTGLKAQELEYAELLRIDAAVDEIDDALTGVMTDDVAWADYLTALAASAPASVQLTGVTVTIDGVVDGTAAPADGSPGGSLDQSGQEHIGALTVTGLAPSHEAVAAWADSLTDVEGFLVPYILGSAVVADGGAAIEFTIEITLSSAVRSLRYDEPDQTAPTEEGGG